MRARAELVDGDAVLVEQARLGDEHAFAELYRLHSGYVRGIATHILRDDSVDDLCQDTFLLAFTRLDSFAGMSKFRTWLTRIAINQCLVRLRTRRHLVPIENADAATERYSTMQTDAALQGAPARMDLEKMMQVLKPLSRRILELRYLEGASREEIAEKLGISATVVSDRIMRAKIKMRLYFS